MSSRPVSVLVVDDNDAKRYALVRLLKHQQFDVTEANTGAAALEAVKIHPDLIVLDVALPDMSGIEVCKKLKENQETARILILHMSATLVDADSRVQGLDSGADAYLTDAVHPNEFIATVRALLRARDAERVLREKEALYELLVTSVEEYAIYTCDSQGIITSWNEGVERIFGYKRDQFLNQHYGIVFASQAEARSDLDAARRNGRVQYDRWHGRGDGSRFYASGSLQSIRNEAGQNVGFVNIVRDVTARRQSEEERASLLASERAAREDAERANRLKDEFLATLSHELRTPLSSILGWTQLLKMHQLPPHEVDEGIAVIERNARAQAQLIEDLLDVSRIISGKINLNFETISLCQLIESTKESFQTAVDAKKIVLNVHCDPDSGTIEGDSARLQQVLSNLVSNAIKFTPQNGAVTLEVVRKPDYVEITVADTGQGIDAKFLPYVFDRFRQADSSTTRSQAGLGLGLAIVRHLVELHGGEIRAESAGTGQGATFRVLLPLIPIPPGIRERGQIEKHRQSDETFNIAPNLSGIKVLIVDDDPDGRDLIRRALEQCQAQVFSAASSAEGFDAFGAHHPDVIVSDIGMPNEDGYGFIRRIRELEGEASNPVPAVALTAFAQSEDRERTLRSGFQMHVSKPVIPQKLVSVVARLCGRNTASPN